MEYMNNQNLNYGNYQDNYRYYCYQMNRIYNYLGRQVYSILKDVDLPEGHPSLNRSLLRLANGCPLPKGHLSLDEILKRALEDTDDCCYQDCCYQDCCYQDYYSNCHNDDC